jgi:arylsulfatase A-like enzyme
VVSSDQFKNGNYNDELTQLYTKEALAFIDAHTNEPFFLYLPHAMPHHPIGASDAFDGTSAGGEYGDTIEEIDWSVGQIMKKLTDLGIDKNTLVIFTSDNGPRYHKSSGTDNRGFWRAGNAHPLRGGKRSTFDGGMREPCIMRWPNVIAAGSVCSEVTTTMDFLPTFGAIAGVAPPKDRVIDGKSILPLMRQDAGAESPYKDDGFLFYSPNQKLMAIRKGKWKFHFHESSYYDPHTQESYDGKTDANSLYNLDDDIGERKNIAGQHAAIVAELKALAEAKDKEIRANARPRGDIAKKNWTGESFTCTPTAANKKPALSHIRKSSPRPAYYSLRGERISAQRKMSKGVYIQQLGNNSIGRRNFLLGR